MKKELTQEELKNDKRNKWFFWSLVLLLPFWILWRNIFPITTYFLNKSTGEGLRMVEKEIAGQRYVLIPLEGDDLISSLKIKADFSQIEKAILKATEETRISLAKDYEVTLYPLGEEIISRDQLEKIVYFENNFDVSNGSLLADENAVYVLSNGQLRPFLSPEVFERLGYQWDKIILNKINPAMSLGERITLQSTHPEGTIFKQKDGTFFIFFQEQRRVVQEELLRELWPDFFWIEVEGAEPVYSNTCLSKNVKQKTIKFDCQFDLKEETNVANIFIAKLDNFQEQQAQDFQLTTVVSVFMNPKKSLSLFVERTRGKLAARYGFLRNL